MQFGRPASNRTIRLSDTDGSRTVLLLASERLELFSVPSSSTYGRRGEATILPPPPDTTAAATRKGGEFLSPERIMVLVLDAPRHA